MTEVNDILSQYSQYYVADLSDDSTTPIEKHDVVEECEPNVSFSTRADGNHNIQIDLDCEHLYVPSSQAGHGHLYIPSCLSSRQYYEFTEALWIAGVVGQGWVDALEIRGHSTLRLPWVRKELRNG